MAMWTHALIRSEQIKPPFSALQVVVECCQGATRGTAESPGPRSLRRPDET